jgi:anti-sigma regulatory factor (Ser/Thr protein kinase)
MEPLTVPAELESLDDIRRYVTAFAEASGLEKKAAYRLYLAVDEIATNIITYGFREHRPCGEVVVSGDVNDEALTITLEDCGEAFDPRSHDMPDAEDLETPLGDREVGGLGIFLALNGVDQFDYRRVGDRNINSFTMRRVPRDG